jgi:two-component sensor histidine kinase
MFEETENRIRSMALVHEKLYQSTNLARIDFTDYIRSLGALLFRSSAINAGVVVFDVSGDEIFFSIDTAVPCGLIVNELLSNALKHAFPRGRRGTIRVELSAAANEIALAVRDDGIGLPKTFTLARNETLGLKLVQALAEQIDGRFTVEQPAAGASFILTIPAERGH